MSSKTYGQICPLARALDILGDRWTLLIVRELLLGPKRFKELLAMLPAMGTNRLSDRMAVLVDSGVAQQIKLGSTGSTQAYELTELGERLRKPVLSLGFWGLDLPIDRRIDPSSVRAELIALCLTGAAPSPEASDLNAIYEFKIDAESFHIRMNNGILRVRSGPCEQAADVRLKCDINTFLALCSREITPDRGVDDGRVTLVLGDRQAFSRMMQILDYRP